MCENAEVWCEREEHLDKRKRKDKKTTTPSMPCIGTVRVRVTPTLAPSPTPAANYMH